ncbi:MAG: hypothetical protein WC587_02995 [Candidatus Paceibacterota bacterium]
MKAKMFLLVMVAITFFGVLFFGAISWAEEEEIYFGSKLFITSVPTARWDETMDPGGQNATESFIRATYGLDEKTAFRNSRIARMLPVLNKDREQTLRISDYDGMYEKNPILGRHPGDMAINAYFIARTAVLVYTAMNLPDPWGVILADSVSWSSEILTRENQQAFAGHPTGKGMPFGIVLTFRF